MYSSNRIFLDLMIFYLRSTKESYHLKGSLPGLINKYGITSNQ